MLISTACRFVTMTSGKMVSLHTQLHFLLVCGFIFLCVGKAAGYIQPAEHGKPTITTCISECTSLDGAEEQEECVRDCVKSPSSEGKEAKSSESKGPVQNECKDAEIVFVPHVVATKQYWTTLPVFQHVAQTAILSLMELGLNMESSKSDGELKALPGDNLRQRNMCWLLFGANALTLDAVTQGQNLLNKLHTCTIVYQLEQLTSDSMWDMQRYFELLKHPNVIVWDYTEENVKFLKSIGVEAALVPLGSHTSLIHPKSPMYSQIYPPSPDGVPFAPVSEEDKDIDFLFVGILNERRHKLLQDLSNYGTIEVAQTVYGPDLYRYIHRARIIVNIHFYDSKLLEVVRITQMLYAGAFVISERGADERQNWMWGDAIVLGDYSNLVRLCREFLSDPTRRKAIMNKRTSVLEKNGMAQFISPVVGDVKRRVSTCPNS